MKLGVIITADKDGNIIYEYRTIIEDGSVTTVCTGDHYERGGVYDFLDRR